MFEVHEYTKALSGLNYYTSADILGGQLVPPPPFASGHGAARAQASATGSEVKTIPSPATHPVLFALRILVPRSGSAAVVAVEAWAHSNLMRLISETTWPGGRRRRHSGGRLWALRSGPGNRCWIIGLLVRLCVLAALQGWALSTFTEIGSKKCTRRVRDDISVEHSPMGAATRLQE